MKLRNVLIMVLLVPMFSCTSFREMNYFTLHQDSGSLNLKNEPGLLVVTFSNNPANRYVSELIADGLKAKSIFRIAGPAEFVNEFGESDKFFGKDAMNNMFITKEGKVQISSVLNKYHAKYLFFTSAATTLSTSDSCISIIDDVSIRFTGILAGSNGEIIGTSDFTLSAGTFMGFGADSKVEDLLKEAAQIVVFNITARLGRK